MIKQMGLILMLFSGMTLGKKICNKFDIEKNVTDWVIPDKCYVLWYAGSDIEIKDVKALASALKENTSLSSLSLWDSGQMLTE